MLKTEQPISKPANDNLPSDLPRRIAITCTVKNQDEGVCGKRTACAQALAWMDTVPGASRAMTFVPQDKDYLQTSLTFKDKRYVYITHDVRALLKVLENDQIRPRRRRAVTAIWHLLKVLPKRPDQGKGGHRKSDRQARDHFEYYRDGAGAVKRRRIASVEQKAA